jgi:hypothetical protein
MNCAMTLLVYVLLGPMVGLLITLFIVLLPYAAQLKYPHNLPAGLGLLVIVAYLVGSIPAFCAGLSIYLFRSKSHRFHFTHVALTGACVGAFCGLVLVLAPNPDPLGALSAIVLCLISSVVCWFPVRLLWRDKKQVDDKKPVDRNAALSWPEFKRRHS